MNLSRLNQIKDICHMMSLCGLDKDTVECVLHRAVIDDELFEMMLIWAQEWENADRAMSSIISLVSLFQRQISDKKV